MPYEAVKAYLDLKLGQDGDYTNLQIYGALKNILRENGARGDIRGTRTEKGEKTLLMI